LFDKVKSGLAAGLFIPSKENTGTAPNPNGLPTSITTGGINTTGVVRKIANDGVGNAVGIEVSGTVTDVQPVKVGRGTIAAANSHIAFYVSACVISSTKYTETTKPMRTFSAISRPFSSNFSSPNFQFSTNANQATTAQVRPPRRFQARNSAQAAN
jgi:hypothetical protein